MSTSRSVWVFSEKFDLSLELIGKGRELAQNLKAELAAILLGHDVKEKAETLAKHGVDKVFCMDSQAFEKNQTTPYLSALSSLAKKFNPEIILIGSTKQGKELAARLAARLETGCIPDCLQLEINDQQRLVASRIVYGGNAIAKLTCRRNPQIATIPQRVFEKAEATQKAGQIIQLEPQAIEESKTEVVDVKEVETTKARIEEAGVVVCGGRGIEKREDFRMLEELAQLINAQVGNTRPLAEDRKWFTEWVGLSGKKVRPVLYVGCGISGMIQHVAGMRDARTVVAINKDPEAPIFQVADYIVVGDAYQIIPALTEALKKMLRKEP